MDDAGLPRLRSRSLTLLMLVAPAAPGGPDSITLVALDVGRLSAMLMDVIPIESQEQFEGSNFWGD